MQTPILPTSLSRGRMRQNNLTRGTNPMQMWKAKGEAKGPLPPTIRRVAMLSSPIISSRTAKIFYSLCVVIPCIFYPSVIQFFHHFIQIFFPQYSEPFTMAKTSHQYWTDCVIAFDEYSAVPRFVQCVVPKTPECPYLGTVIRAVYTGRNIAPFRFRGFIRRI